jgi:hypothetical protein
MSDENKKPAEQWAETKKHTGRAAWKFAAARAAENWPVGAELTESEYDAAVNRALNVAVK